jgi:hypothetical protein
MEQAAKRFVANPAGDKDDAAMLRVQFETWAANDAKFQAVAGDNALLNEIKPVSKDLSALGVAALRMLDYLTANQPAPADWLTEENTELTRLSRPARGGNRPPAAAPGGRCAASPRSHRGCTAGRVPAGEGAGGRVSEEVGRPSRLNAEERQPHPRAENRRPASDESVGNVPPRGRRERGERPVCLNV